MLTEKQISLLEKVFIPYKKKYKDLSIEEFVYKFTKKEIKDLDHKAFYFMMQKVNAKYDYWVPTNTFNGLKINMKNIKYIIDEETDDYIIGNQYKYENESCEFKKYMKIMAFRRLMVLDYDCKCKETKKDVLNDVINILENSGLVFMIYSTKNGYHAYCISREFEINNDTYQLMYDLKCDVYYISFVKYVGFVVRLEKKPNREEEYIEKFVMKIGSGEENEKLKKLLDIKDNLIK